MNSKLLSFMGTIWLTGVCAGFSQAPPNDYFTNRIQLTGSDVIFVGNVAGATVEPWEWNDGFTASVWWTWTATDTTQVHIVARSYSQPNYNDATLAVYTDTNIFGWPGIDNLLWPNSYWDKLTLSFEAVAGTSYQIRFAGDLPALSVTFELIATNAPLIVQQPIDQTVVTNGAALFTVVAVGIPPLHYQWRFNGSDIPGANDPMLAFDSVTNELAGEYAVAVSNSTGFAVSSSVRLTVNATATQPLLRAVAAASNSFSFALNGDSGRYYRIESSTDLRNWQPELAFPHRWPMVTSWRGAWPATTNGNFVLAAGSNSLFTIPRTARAKYLRASLYTPANETCINHLRQIRFAKDLWARSTKQAFNALPTGYDLSAYCANIDQLSCPFSWVQGLGASYYLNAVAGDPQCEVVTSHILEEPELTVLPP